MTTKSIQQRAAVYARSVAMTALDAENIAKDYTAGANDERRELGRVILQIVDGEFFYQHAELIARLREELK